MSSLGLSKTKPNEAFNGAEMRSLVEALAMQGTPFEQKDIHWIPKLQANLGRELPPGFRKLFANYEFPVFDVAGVTIFSNLNDASETDITVAPFSDAFMSPWLIKHGFMQFGRPDTGSYDPVCLDLTTARRDASVVVIDHEDILQGRRKVYVRELATSFGDLLRAGVHNKRLHPSAQ